MPVTAVIFVIISFGLLFFSLPSLRHPRAHGFYRFFAFESILGLILLNLESWFRNPFSPRQIISWVLLLSSLFLAAQGFYYLLVAGKPKGGIESTTTLVKSGVYRYIRHPLYSSLFILGWGIFVKQPSIPGLVIAHAAMFSLIATAKTEEKENVTKFGNDYKTYMKTTKRFIPFVF